MVEAGQAGSRTMPNVKEVIMASRFFGKWYNTRKQFVEEFIDEYGDQPDGLVAFTLFVRDELEKRDKAGETSERDIHMRFVRGMQSIWGRK